MTPVDAVWLRMLEQNVHADIAELEVATAIAGQTFAYKVLQVGPPPRPHRRVTVTTRPPDPPPPPVRTWRILTGMYVGIVLALAPAVAPT